ncbi:MAG: alpha-ketoacid dehydrogenase subunit beta, partial [Alphaproteobacteria bacterium]|nr:alpha-ketoacid dehydrogenase subunit beta [Alphaproteobacteria bacterium]
TTCPTTPALEKDFYPNATTIAARAFAMVRPDEPAWTPDAEPTLPHEAAFKGPF